MSVFNLMFNLFVGESGDRLVVIQLSAPTEARSVSQASSLML